MPKKMPDTQRLNQKPTKEYFVWIVAISIGLFTILSVSGALRHPLWADEAETGIFARTILQRGLPFGWDGRNIMGLRNGIRLNSQLLNNVEPWLPYYLTAGSFFLFGISTFTARVPSLVISVFTLIYLLFFSYRISRNKRVAVMTIVMLSVNVPFLLFAYQARYYALAALASCVFTYTLLEILMHKKFSPLLFITSGVIFFHANYLSFIPYYGASLLSLFVLDRKAFRFWKQIAVSSLIIGLLTLPWVLIVNPFSTPTGEFLSNFNLQHATELSLRYFKDFNDNGGFPFVWVIAIIWLIARTNFYKKYRYLMYIWCLFSTFILFLSLVSIQQIVSSVSDIRYAMNIFPLLLFANVTLIEYVWQKKSWLGFLLFATLTVTNLFTLNSSPRIWVMEYLNEIFNSEYQSSTGRVITYLTKHSQVDETVFVSPDYYNEPIIFYLGNRVRVINRILPDNTRILATNQLLPQYVYKSPIPPDWIVLFGTFNQYDMRELPRNVSLGDYEKTQVTEFALDLTRPELFYHVFSPVQTTEEKYHIIIYHKKRATQSQQSVARL